jgi:dephospho-CoA kinase
MRSHEGREAVTGKRPFLIGLTGSIGMGKTETAKMFLRLGVPVYDADAAVHRLYEPGGAAVAAIGEAFPGSVVEGRVDRAALSRALASDSHAFERLERIVHPLTAKEQQAFLAKAQQDGAEMVVLDIPLLLETGSEALVDALVVVSAPADLQRSRVLTRPGMTIEKFDQILARQMPDVDKRARAHFVIETSGGLEHAFEQVKAVVAELHRRRLAQK